MKHVLALAFCVIAASPAYTSEYYKIQVSRKSSNLYEIINQDIYIVTRYCYEYAIYTDAILKIDSTVGFTIGEIIFVGNGSTKCDVEKLLR